MDDKGTNEGTVYVDAEGGVFIKVSLGNKRRKTAKVPSATSEDEGRARARLASNLCSKLRAAGKDDWTVRTVEQVARADSQKKLDDIARVVDLIVADRWPPRDEAPLGGVSYADVRALLTDGTLHRRYPTIVRVMGKEHAADIKYKSETYVEPVIGDLPIAAVDLPQCNEVMARIEAKYGDALSDATKQMIAWTMKRVLDLSVNPLGLRPSNPLPSNFVPKGGGKRRARGFIHVEEEAKLLAGRNAAGDTVVPLSRRILYGALVREGFRKEEASTLQWSDERSKDAAGWFDSERAELTLEIHKTVDRVGPRFWNAADDVAEALRIWRTLQPTKSRFVFAADGQAAVNVEKLADDLREDLRAVGIDRPELFESTKTRKQLVAHDLRACFATMAFARAESETWIMMRTGHVDSRMLNQKYRRPAAHLAERGQTRYRSMVEAIPELAAHAAAVRQVSSGAADGRGRPRRRARKLRRRRPRPQKPRNRTLEAVGSIPISSTE